MSAMVISTQVGSVKASFAVDTGASVNVLSEQFLLDGDGVLCRYWPNKQYPVTQFVIREEYVPIVLQMIHDSPDVGH